MCTNFTPTKKSQWVKEKLRVDLPAEYPAESYPGFAAPVVVKSHQTGRIACGLAKFGLIPSWAKDDKIARHTYNARSETAADKPSYRTAWRQRQYGLLLVGNFYEPSYESGQAVRWKIELASGDPSALPAYGTAGLIRLQVRWLLVSPCSPSTQTSTQSYVSFTSQGTRSAPLSSLPLSFTTNGSALTLRRLQS